jgi:hypothetical protein
MLILKAKCQQRRKRQRAVFKRTFAPTEKLALKGKVGAYARVCAYASFKKLASGIEKLICNMMRLTLIHTIKI